MIIIHTQIPPLFVSSLSFFCSPSHSLSTSTQTMAGGQMLFGSSNDPAGTGHRSSMMIVPIEPKPCPAASESSKPRGRKASGKPGNGSSATGAAGQKKQPQRGMGVAQLERLRLQERFKKMTEINPSLLPPPVPRAAAAGAPPAAQIQNQNHPFPYLDPASPACGVPVHLPKFTGFGPVVGHGFPVQDGAAAMLAAATGKLFPGGCQMGQCGGGGIGEAGDPARGRAVAGVFEGFGSELPSIPKTEVPQQFDHHHHHFTPAGLSSKKKRVNGDEKEFREEICTENCSRGVEVVAVHRKCNAAGRVGLLMEYGFFPREGSSCKGNIDMTNTVSGSSCCPCFSSSSSSHYLPQISASSMGGAVGAAAGRVAADFSLFRSDSHDPSIDLSLRL